MYTGTAQYYDEFYSYRDYASISQRLISIIEQHLPTAKSLLDVGCGTGQLLGHIQSRYKVEGLDIDLNLLSVAALKHPEIPFHHADMADFQLARRFDVVTCLFRSIGYVLSVDRLRRSIAAMSQHLNPGGLLVLEPFFSPDDFWINDLRLNVFERPDLKIAWMYTSTIEDGHALYQVHYLIGKPAGVEHIVERHELGLFTHNDLHEAFLLAGLDPSFEKQGLREAGLYIARCNSAEKLNSGTVSSGKFSDYDNP